MSSSEDAGRADNRGNPGPGRPSKQPDKQVNDATLQAQAAPAPAGVNFEELYNQFRGKVFSTAYRMVSNRADAEDITQDVFIKVFRKLDAFRGEAKLSTWIYRITVNACLDFRRRRRRRETVPLDDVAEPGAVKLSVGRLIESAIPELPPGCREVFVLHDIQGLKHNEIAESLGISEGASKSQLHRARGLLRRKLAPFVDRVR
jgi:RNA polymerase sigma-70 factor (ECF subfamily)